MTIRTSLFALASVIVLAAGQAQAAFTGFTADEGYTNGNLHGQVDWTTAWPSNMPNGYVVDTTATGYDGSLGIVTMTSNWAYWAESIDMNKRGDTAVAKAVLRYNATGTGFTNPGNGNSASNGQILEMAFLGGGNLIRATLRRGKSRTSDGNRSRMSIQFASNGTGGQSAIAIDEHYEEHAGVGATGTGQSDWLEYTLKLIRGKNRSDWKLEVLVKNLSNPSEGIIVAGRWNVKTSLDFFNDHTLIARINGQPDANIQIVAGSRQIDTFEVSGYHQNINYDEVCDGNIDGAKSKAEETSTGGVTGNWTKDTNDPWWDWGYLGGNNFIGSVGHDKFGKFGSHKDSDAAVTQTGRKWLPGLGRAPIVDETIEWSANYRMSARAGLVEQVHLDMYLTSNGINTGEGTDPATKIAYAINNVEAVSDANEYLKMLGVRISQDDNGGMAVQLKPALNYSGIGSSNNVTGWVPLADIGIDGADLEGDHLNIAYRAKKTETPSIWDCSVVISNRESGATWTFEEDGMTNAALYSAGPSIYPTVYDPKGFSGGTDGFEIDDLICRILYTNYFDLPPGPWVAFVDDYGLSGVKSDDDDGDDLNDWGEYVFGGNPTNSADIGALPTFDPDAGNYGFSLIGDDDVIAHVVTNTDLITGSWGTNSTVTVLVTDGVLSNYTDHIGTEADQVYIKLLVE